ncbi:MAG: TlpA family protein disulfide reductase [Deltaproteobacteria bacterium]|nr:TlpA family protein disulfide reductase [Deltaproteobacteria bacterium]
MNFKKAVGLIVITTIVLTTLVLYVRKLWIFSSKSEYVFENALLKIGAEPPALELTDVNGREHVLSHYKGKVVLINYWASWCPPCLLEMPSLVSAHRKLKDKGFEVLAINLDEHRKTVLSIIEKFKLPFPVFWDPHGDAARKYLIYGLPYTLILDRKGTVQHKFYGGYEWDTGAKFKLLEALL